MNIVKKLVAFSALVAAFSSVANDGAAQSVSAKYCVGSVDMITVTQSGRLHLEVQGSSGSAGHSFALCGIDGSWGGVSGDVCRAWLLTLQHAQAAQVPVRIKHVNNVHCSAMDWYTNASAPESVMVDRTP